MPEFGIEPVVFCPENPNYPKTDDSLQKEIPKGIKVLQYPSNDLVKFFFSKRKSSKKGNSNLTNNKFLSFIRGNFFIPDAKITWVKPASRFLKNYLESNPVDAIISTGPPHSMHLIASYIKENLGIRWIADFRDPWTDLYYHKEFYLTSYAKKKNEWLENKVLQEADLVLTVSRQIQQRLMRTARNVEVITNGFDDEALEKKNVILDENFTIGYIGLLPKSSIPYHFFEVLSEMTVADPQFKNDFRLKFAGDINDEVKTLVKKAQLESHTEYLGYVSHNRAVELQQTSQVLLLLIPDVPNNKGIVTGKLFEYLAANRPILALGPTDGDLQDIMSETEAGTVVTFDDKKAIKLLVRNFYERYKRQELQVSSKNIEQYHRKNLTEKLVQALKKMHS